MGNWFDIPPPPNQKGSYLSRALERMYRRARTAECELDALQARLMIMRGVSILGWTAFILHVWGVR